MFKQEQQGWRCFYRRNCEIGKTFVHAHCVDAQDINGRMLGRFKTIKEAEQAILEDDDDTQATLKR